MSRNLAQAPETSVLPEQSIWTFRRVMARARLRPARAAFDTAFRPADLSRPEEVAKVNAAYEALVPAPPGAQHPIEKTIWMLWQQGWDKAPSLVRRCAESWQSENPGWTVVLLDQDSLPEYATGYAERVPAQLTRQHRADLARTMLIAEHGGVWADATLFCSRPLDDWLPHAARSGFFMFAWPRPYRIVDNWFIVGAKGNRVIAAMLDLYFQYWRHFDRPHHYFWMIYLIEHLFRIDPASREVWNNTPKLSALGPLVMERHAFDPSPDPTVIRLIDDKRVPVHKLKHKWSAQDLTGTPLERLTGPHSVVGTEG